MGDLSTRNYRVQSDHRSTGRTRTSPVGPICLGVVLSATFGCFFFGISFDFILSIFASRDDIEISGSRVWNFVGAGLGTVVAPMVAAVANDRELMRQADPDYIASPYFPRLLVVGVIAGFLLALAHVILFSAKVNFG